MPTKDIKTIMVSTPKGLRFHGTVKNIDGTLVFWREVNYFKDRMRIFDAFSIHPDALNEITKMGVKKICYHDAGENKYYIMSVKKLNDLITGFTTDGEGRAMAWMRKFAGGNTVYIKLDAFKLIEA